MNEIKRIRKSVESILGKKVHLTTNVGRNTFVEAQGVITSAYPNLFTVTLEDGQNNDQAIS
ncbi:MAG: Veg family protein, partial [Fenollaria timonensis]